MGSRDPQWGTPPFPPSLELEQQNAAGGEELPDDLPGRLAPLGWKSSCPCTAISSRFLNIGRRGGTGADEPSPDRELGVGSWDFNNYKSPEYRWKSGYFMVREL
ncbi:hypothetical protein Vafri_12553 [Volvox africanus]|uniref:Uncharacterized protein n=1 Tax=Volvox africanus TaxID=51714 RepID=A0A8J4BB41_9CHLO|nr:hypothetical protein Vafri_12553 [Volvox africanus]